MANPFASPVDYNPFAPAGTGSAPASAASGVTPVDHNPFASGEGSFTSVEHDPFSDDTRRGRAAAFRAQHGDDVPLPTELNAPESSVRNLSDTMRDRGGDWGPLSNFLHTEGADDAAEIAGKNLGVFAHQVARDVPLLVGGAGAKVVDAAHGLLSGRDETGAQDYVFRNTVDPFQHNIDVLESTKPQARGVIGQTVDKTSGMAGPLALALAAPELEGVNAGLAVPELGMRAALRGMTDTAAANLPTAVTMAAPGAVEAGKAAAEKGGDAAAVGAATLGDLSKGAVQNILPMATGGTLATKLATGAGVNTALGAAGRAAAGQGTDATDVLSDAIIGAGMGAMHREGAGYQAPGEVVAARETPGKMPGADATTVANEAADQAGAPPPAAPPAPAAEPSGMPAADVVKLATQAVQEATARKLSPVERFHVDFLKKNMDNPEALAEALGVKLEGEDNGQDQSAGGKPAAGGNPDRGAQSSAAESQSGVQPGVRDEGSTASGDAAQRGAGETAHVQPENGELLDAPNFGMPEPAKALPDDHELLQSHDTDQSPERVAMRDRLVAQRFEGKAPAPEGQKPVAIVMGGGGASGKGTVLRALRVSGKLPEGAVELDPDSFKTGNPKAGHEGIPEYHPIVHAGDSRAAAVTHEESSAIYKQALARGIEGRFNLVLDRTMADSAKGLKDIEALKKAGYEVRMVGVTVHPGEAVKRAVQRAAGPEKRYVPIKELLKAHKGFSNAVDHYAPHVDALDLYDNNVNRGELPHLIATGRDGAPLEIHDPERYTSFRGKGNLNEAATSHRQLEDSLGSPAGRSDPGAVAGSGEAARAGTAAVRAAEAGDHRGEREVAREPVALSTGALKAAGKAVGNLDKQKPALAQRAVAAHVTKTIAGKRMATADGEAVSLGKAAAEKLTAGADKPTLAVLRQLPDIIKAATRGDDGTLTAPVTINGEPHTVRITSKPGKGFTKDVSNIASIAVERQANQGEGNERAPAPGRAAAGAAVGTDAGSTEAAGPDRGTGGNGTRETAGGVRSSDRTVARDEDGTSAAPAAGAPFIVFRVGNEGGLSGRNAGNANAIARFLAQSQDHLNPVGTKASTITAYEVSAPKGFEQYQGTHGGTGAGESVGRVTRGREVSYSFPRGAEAKKVASVSVDDLHAMLAKRGYTDFDESGSNIGAEVLRNWFEQHDAAPRKPTAEAQKTEAGAAVIQNRDRARNASIESDHGRADHRELNALRDIPPDKSATITHLRRDLAADPRIGNTLGVLEHHGALHLIDDPNQHFAGRFDGQRLILNAAYLPRGEALGAALHEVVHRELADAGGLRAFVGPGEFDRLQRRLDLLKAEGGPAAELVAQAEARAAKSGETGARLDQERLTYFTQAAREAQTAGTLPAKAALIYRQVVAAIRAAFYNSKFGAWLRTKGSGVKLTPDDFVALAEHAAQRQARAAVRAEGDSAGMTEQGAHARPRGYAPDDMSGGSGNERTPEPADGATTHDAGMRQGDSELPAGARPEQSNIEKPFDAAPSAAALRGGIPQQITSPSIAQRAAAAIRSMLPKHPSAERELVRNDVRSALANRDRAIGTADAATHAFVKYFDQRGQDVLRDPLKAMESAIQFEKGQPVTDPHARPFFAAMRQMLDEQAAQIRSFGQGYLEHLVTDYFPHLWEDPQGATTFMNSQLTRRPLGGNKKFTKERVFDTLEDGINAGMKPVTHNPAEMVMMRYQAGEKLLTQLRIMDALEQRGLVQQVPNGQRIPKGWAHVNDPAFGNKLVPDFVARDLNNYLDPGLTRFAAWRGFRWLQNFLLTARLGLSAFHAGMTTLDTIATHADIGWRRALVLGDLAGGLKELGKIPTAIYRSPLEGGRLVKQFYGQMAADPHTAAILDMLAEGGARGYMSPTDFNDSFTKMVRAWRQGDAVGRITHTLPGLLEASTRLISHKLVPAQKMTARVMHAKFKLDELAESLGKQKGDYAGIVDALHPDAMREISYEINKTIDDRLGQFAYDNLFWNKTARDALHASVQSVGWNFGTARLLLGGAKDAITAGKNLATGGAEHYIAPLDKAGKLTNFEKAKLTDRLSYLVTLNAVVAMAGATLQFAMTGQAPNQTKDFFFPRTGRTNPDGSDERLSFPSYVKDEFAIATHPFVTAQHKLHPIFNMAAELASNRDFYGTEIYNPDATLPSEVKDVLTYLGKSFLPYSVKGSQQSAGTGKSAIMQALPFIGITPAPGDIAKSSFNQYVSERFHEKHGVRTQAEAEHSKELADAISKLHDDPNADISNLDAKGQRFAHKAQNSQLTSYRFGKLSLEQQAHAYELATPAEREQFDLSRIIHKGFEKRLQALAPEDRQTVLDRIQSAEGEQGAH
jgi:hypothetical protein